MIDQFISELLFKYDTVILPGFGAFILKYKPAAIIEDTNVLSPPSKQIIFDSSMKNNDGILANYISDKERISFFEACNKILAFVEEINKSLSEGKQFTLKKIGVFSKTSDNNITFIPDVSVNYNLDAYGMEDIAITTLHDDIKEISIKQIDEKIPAVRKRKVFSRAAIWILIIVIFIGVSIATLFIIKPGFVSNIKFGNLFKHVENKGIFVAKEQTKKDTLTEIKNNTKATDTVNTDTSSSNERYYIISASFRITDNANKYAETLIKKGYDSKVIFMQDKGMNAVSYNSYKSKSEAEQALSKIKIEKPDAWILLH